MVLYVPVPENEIFKCQAINRMASNTSPFILILTVEPSYLPESRTMTGFLNSCFYLKTNVSCNISAKPILCKNNNRKAPFLRPLFELFEKNNGYGFRRFYTHAWAHFGGYEKVGSNGSRCWQIELVSAWGSVGFVISSTRSSEWQNVLSDGREITSTSPVCNSRHGNQDCKYDVNYWGVGEFFKSYITAKYRDLINFWFASQGLQGGMLA